MFLEELYTVLVVIERAKGLSIRKGKLSVLKSSVVNQFGEEIRLLFLRPSFRNYMYVNVHEILLDDCLRWIHNSVHSVLVAIFLLRTLVVLS